MQFCRLVVRFTVGLSAAAVTWAQMAPTQGGAATGRETPRSALSLESVSLFGYAGNSVRGGDGGGTGAALQPHVGMGGSSAVRWLRSRDRSHFSMNYLASYLSPTRYTDSAVNQSLALSYQKSLLRTWTWSASAAAGIQHLDQAMFAPSRFASAADVPGTFDDLAGALNGGLGTDPQLGAILGGAQILDSPGAALLYGTRLWTASVQTGLTWAPRPLTTIHFDLSGGRTGQLPTDSDRERAVLSPPLVSASTNASAGLGITHSLSPRTQVGVSFNTSRSRSLFQDAYYDSVRVSASRNLSRRWFGEVHGGVGSIRPVRLVQTIATGAQYLAGGTLAYRTLAHTFLFGHDRSIGDQYGIGAGTTQTTNVAWNWRRPARSWWVQLSVGHQYMPGTLARDLTMMRGNALFGRTLTRNSAITVQYAHMRYSGAAFGNMLNEYSPYSVRVGIVWSPAQPLLR